MLQSDFGWGCMIRCGQMMLANAMLMHLKRIVFNQSRKTIIGAKPDNSHKGLGIDDLKDQINVYEDIERDVISKFLDSRVGKDSPFSIHEITNRGLELFHKVAGDWYGTNSISQVLKSINNQYKPFEDFEICVFNNDVIFKDEIIMHGSEEFSSVFDKNSSSESQGSSPDNSQEQDFFVQTRGGANQSGGSKEYNPNQFEKKSQHSGGGSATAKDERPNTTSFLLNNDDAFVYYNKRRRWNKCVLVIVNIMLGINKIPEETYPEITKMFKIPQMIGILGGKGKFGLYFVGVQNDSLIMLDPHLSQETVHDEEEIKQNRDTYR